jgi:hypothetical protein
MLKRARVVAEESLRVTFDGPGVTGGTINARQLGLSLVNLADAITSAHAAVRSDDLPAPTINIRETGEGSFWVDLTVLVESGPVQSVIEALAGKYSTAAANLGGIVGLTITSMGFLKWRKGRKVKKTERIAAPDAQPDPITGIVPAESVRVEFVDGTVATIPAAVWAASESANFQKAARDTVRPAASQGIDSVKIEHTDSAYSQNEELTVTNDEVEFFDLPEPEEAVETTSTYKALVSPHAINFEKGKKWRLSDGERSFLATIADEDFAREVDNGRIHIGKHDSFRVELQESITAPKSSRPKTAITVLKVLEHISAGRQQEFDYDQQLPDGVSN